MSADSTLLVASIRRLCVRLFLLTLPKEPTTYIYIHNCFALCFYRTRLSMSLRCGCECSTSWVRNMFPGLDPLQTDEQPSHEQRLHEDMPPYMRVVQRAPESPATARAIPAPALAEGEEDPSRPRLPTLRTTTSLDVGKQLQSASNAVCPPNA